MNQQPIDQNDQLSRIESLQSEVDHLTERESLYLDLYEHSPDMLASIDAKTKRILRCNQTLIDTLNMTREEIVGTDIFDLYHEDCQRTVEETFALFKRTGVVCNADLLLKLSDGSALPVNLNVSSVRDKSGKVIESRSVWRDVTELNTARNKLEALNSELEIRVLERTERARENANIAAQKAEAAQENYKKFRGVLDQTFQFIGVVSLDGTLVDANRTALNAAGVAAEDVLGKKFWDTVWWQHSPELQRRLKAAIENAVNGNMDRFEATHPTSDGSIIYIDFSIKPVMNESGEVTFLIPEGRDITELHQARLQMNHYAAELEKRNEDLDAFARSASHDLKAPLRSIANLTTWVLEDGGDEIPEICIPNLHKIQNQISQMRNYLTELLEFATAGRQLGQVSKRSLTGVIESAAQLVFIPEGFEFSIDVEPDDLEVETFATPLTQCLQNLIANAIAHHHRPQGSVHVRGRTAGDNIMVEVTDDGPGIEPLFHKTIFELFATLKPKTENGSTGVGLAIVKRLVDSVGGKIEVQSQSGKGTTFCLTWPNKEPEITVN